jgi:hypothetical protein
MIALSHQTRAVPGSPLYTFFDSSAAHELGSLDQQGNFVPATTPGLPAGTAVMLAGQPPATFTSLFCVVGPEALHWQTATSPTPAANSDFQQRLDS